VRDPDTRPAWVGEEPRHTPRAPLRVPHSLLPAAAFLSPRLNCPPRAHASVRCPPTHGEHGHHGTARAPEVDCRGLCSSFLAPFLPPSTTASKGAFEPCFTNLAHRSVRPSLSMVGGDSAPVARASFLNVASLIPRRRQPQRIMLHESRAPLGPPLPLHGEGALPRGARIIAAWATTEDTGKGAGSRGSSMGFGFSTIPGSIRHPAHPGM
jgi:hypothetical protein